MTKIRKYSLALIITAAIIIEAMGAVQYFMAQHGVKKELLAKAERDMKESQRVATVKARVESAVENILPEVKRLAATPDEYRILMSRLVTTNADIVGAGVAFPRDHYKADGHEGLFAPYAYDTAPALTASEKKNHQSNVVYRQLPFDYTGREWFLAPLNEGRRLWTQPYLDQGGTKILMCTYAVPVEVNGRRVGVFYADVALSDVSVLSQDLYSGIRTSGMVTLGIQLLSLLLMGFIVWRAAAASRRYKEKYVDPEKAHLVEQMTKLREVNTRLTKRNQELAEKVANLQRRIDAGPQQSDQHWFG